MAKKNSTPQAAESQNHTTTTTQRAYTLRLRPAILSTDSPEEVARKAREMQDALWATHEAINKGAKVFGDWLLTLRGGLSHELAEPPPAPKGKKRSEEETAALRKNRRILLALSWLSVEDERGAPAPDSGLIVAYGDRCKSAQDSQSSRDCKVVEALRAILTTRKLSRCEIDAWIGDCEDSLKVRIRDDAVWINRSASFDAARQEIGPSLTREEVWDVLEPFFASRESYLAQVELKDDDSGEEEKAKDLVQKAGQWLSSRFGTGTGADFAAMSKVYGAMTEWAEKARPFSSGTNALADLGKALARFKPGTTDADGILALISGPGYKSATRNMVKDWGGRARAVSKDDLAKFTEVTAEDQAKCKANVGGKGHRPWSDMILHKVEDACGFTYLQKDGPARHSEFAVLLDHAARRVSIGHSWIKRAEAQRRKFEEDAKRLGNVPEDAAAWLDEFIAERGGTSGATAAGGEYRIRRRAIEAWDEVVKQWKRASCKTEEDRVAAAREVQSDPEIEKFGDIQLFEALAADDAVCVWRQDGRASAEILADYVLGHDARFKQRRYKVPAYRHPDPLRHPVFGDFGNSRWMIEYAVHEARKAAGKKRAPSPADAAWLKDHHGLRMGLWDGSVVRKVPLRWSSKRLAKDLALRATETGKPAHDVGRADRLGLAASGVGANETPNAAALFALADWNGRLQAPRGQLEAIANHVDKHRWDARAKAMLDRIQWLVSFSAKLECRGPFVPHAMKHGLIEAGREIELAPRGEKNEWRGIAYPIWHPANDGHKGLAKHILSRVPIRILAVDLGHRFAAACVVWEALSGDELKEEIASRQIVAGGIGSNDLFVHTRHKDEKTQKERTTIYRRIGDDFLRDPKTHELTGTLHPAPWARLDRQFLIKLQGEEMPARAAARSGDVDEVGMVAALSASLGLTAAEEPDEHHRGRAVDELMSRAVRVLTLALKRHGRRAKIAYALDPKTKTIPGSGGSERPFTRGDEDHIKFLTNALLDWHALASESKWADPAARALWNQHIQPLAHGFEIGEPTPSDPDAERPTRKQRRESEEQLRAKLEPIAKYLAKADAESTGDIHRAWVKRWNKDDGVERTKDDFGHTPIRDAQGKVIGSRTTPKAGKASSGGWHERLRMLTDWVMGRRLPGATSDGWKQNLGGLSLTRIATMKSLYQLHKAFAMRARPDRPQGAPEKGETNAGVAQRILDAMEGMREQRVKQLASRIAAAALGLGGHWKEVERRSRGGKAILDLNGRPRTKWVWVEEPSPKYPACHAVVIENLTNYRPDELQTRRENRALMTWSAGKVRKYLEEACQLHGLHLREVMPNYTSRQCSRTGLPGVRCADVAVDTKTGEPKAFWWKKAHAVARKKTGDAESRFIVDLAKHLEELKAQGKTLPSSVRIPRRGGDLFVAAPPGSCHADNHRPCPLCNTKSALQADLNAAANIGLRALLDPDFPGKWWYVPCDSATGKPAKDKCSGAACLDLDEALIGAQKVKDDTGSGGESKGREKTNAWADVGGVKKRCAHSQYWDEVVARVVARLRVFNGLDTGSSPQVAAVEPPW